MTGNVIVSIEKILSGVFPDLTYSSVFHYSTRYDTLCKRTDFYDSHSNPVAAVSDCGGRLEITFLNFKMRNVGELARFIEKLEYKKRKKVKMPIRGNLFPMAFFHNIRDAYYLYYDGEKVTYYPFFVRSCGGSLFPGHTSKFKKLYELGSMHGFVVDALRIPVMVKPEPFYHRDVHKNGENLSIGPVTKRGFTGLYATRRGLFFLINAEPATLYDYRRALLSADYSLGYVLFPENVPLRPALLDATNRPALTDGHAMITYERALENFDIIQNFEFII